MNGESLTGCKDSREPKIERVNSLVRDLKIKAKGNYQAAVKISSCILGPDPEKCESKLADTESNIPRGWLDKLIDDLETLNTILSKSSSECVRLINELGHYNKE